MKNLQTYVDNGYVSVQKHPHKDLYIYNYTQKAQFEKMWDDITLSCRGLILDGENNVVARPFRKFFNREEHEASEIPNEPFKVYNKEDGSLFILVKSDDIITATRGSFTSDQAIKGTEILHTKYPNIVNKLNPDYTYLLEVVYPQNRIVLDYGSNEDLILLAVRDTQSDVDLPLEDFKDLGFPLVEEYNGVKDFDKLKELNLQNKEGFVLLFKNGFRMKIKFEEYVRLHRIVTCVSSKTIWEYLKDNKDFDELLDKVPDEFFQWVRLTISKFKREYGKLKAEAYSVFLNCDVDKTNRKEFALWAQKQKDSKILFLLLDNKEIKSYLWSKLKPMYERPFA